MLKGTIMLKPIRWTVAGVFICALGAGVSAGQPPVAQGNDQTGLSLELDEPSILPELLSIPPIGPHEIIDIAPTNEGFLVAAGAGVSRWRYVDGMPRYQESIPRADGSPLGPCLKLLKDRKGGVWINGIDGVGYLARGGRSPRWFTVNDGLPEGGIRDMAFSADGERLWIAGPGGLATTDTGDYRWRVFKKNNLVDLAVHPSKDVVWCRQLRSSSCMCGRQLATVQFDLSTEQWLSISISGTCAPVAPRLALYRKTSNWAWFSSGHNSPLAIDLETNKVYIWPRQPLWEHIDAKGVMHYNDRLGQIVSANDETGDVWCASEAGAWRYDHAANRWQGYKYLAKPLYGNPKVIWSHDGRTLYWSCNGNVAALDTKTRIWRPLWNIQKRSYKKSDAPLLLSPNGETLWQTGPWGVAVGDPEGHTGRVLNDKAVPGLTEAKFVRFDEDRKLALVATPRGIVITDYHGVPQATLTNPPPHVQHRVVAFRFTADGNEVWCLTKDDSGHSMPARVYFPKTRQWQMVPETESKGHFFDVAFSKDGGTVWLSHRRADEEHTPILQRKSGTTAWKPLAAQMPDWHNVVEKFYLTPKGDELWMTGDGILRVCLTDGKVTYYQKEHVTAYEGVTPKPLVVDYVADLVFVQKGTLAVCAASGGGEVGLSLIDLKTNTVTNLLLGDISPIEKLLVEPDDRTITCIFNSARPRKFDTKERKWLGKGPVGECEGMFGATFHGAKPLAVGGNCTLISDERGIVKVNRMGDELDVFSPAPGETGFRTSHILPIPGGDEHLCAIARMGETGIYRLDVESRQLRLVKRFTGNVTGLAIAPDDRAWAGLPGRIVCFDTMTGEEFPLWPKGETRLPAVAAVKDLPDSVFAGITMAPRKIEKVRVLPPRKPPKIGKPIAMENCGMVWPSGHRPVIATSESGKRYVMWFAYPGKTKATVGGLPLIPREFLPKKAAGPFNGATGLRVWSEGKWSAPQLLLSGKIPRHTVHAAWCQREDLHMLLDTGDLKRLTHLCFQSAENKWTKIAELDHDVRAIEIRGPCAHLATSDYDGKRFGYRVFDGNRWSGVHWFERRSSYNGITLAVTDDDAHLIWNESNGAVAHAVINFQGQSQVFRQTFRERPLGCENRDYLAVADPGGSLAFIYTADLYRGHPDRHLPHIRTWLGDRWSAPKTIPFPTWDSITNPIAVQHGDQTLVSWSYVPPGDINERTRFYSIRDKDGAWTTPTPLYLNDKGKPLRSTFIGLHVDRAGRVYTAWNAGLENAETFFAEVTRLGKQ